MYLLNMSCLPRNTGYLLLSTNTKEVQGYRPSHKFWAIRTSVIHLHLFDSERFSQLILH